MNEIRRHEHDAEGWEQECDCYTLSWVMTTCLEARLNKVHSTPLSQNRTWSRFSKSRTWPSTKISHESKTKNHSEILRKWTALARCSIDMNWSSSLSNAFNRSNVTWPAYKWHFSEANQDSEKNWGVYGWTWPSTKSSWTWSLVGGMDKRICSLGSDKYSNTLHTHQSKSSCLVTQILKSSDGNKACWPLQFTRICDMFGMNCTC